jgi:hypothetical protein
MTFTKLFFLTVLDGALNHLYEYISYPNGFILHPHVFYGICEHFFVIIEIPLGCGYIAVISQFLYQTDINAGINQF